MTDDLLARLRECLPTVADGPDSRVWCSVLGADLRGSIDTIERLTAERDALRKDAERYRWLRDVGSCTWNPLQSQWRTFSAEGCDRIVDAAMQKPV